MNEHGHNESALVCWCADGPLGFCPRHDGALRSDMFKRIAESLEHWAETGKSLLSASESRTMAEWLRKQ